MVEAGRVELPSCEFAFATSTRLSGLSPATRGAAISTLHQQGNFPRIVRYLPRAFSQPMLESYSRILLGYLSGFLSPPYQAAALSGCAKGE